MSFLLIHLLCITTSFKTCLDFASKKLVGISLECLGNFFEDMSFMDSEVCCNIPAKSGEGFDFWSAKVSPGLQDDFKNHATPRDVTWKRKNMQNELRGALEVASLHHSHTRFHDLCDRKGGELVNGSCSWSCFDNVAETKNMAVTERFEETMYSAKCVDQSTSDAEIFPCTVTNKNCLQVTMCNDESWR